ncbi:MAG: hypothetical protein KF849_13325 [Rhizobiaceae bacterium]|nr:hypothetical protein [Rhizobiaceae bacterium]
MTLEHKATDVADPSSHDSATDAFDVLPWLTNPQLALAHCPADEITIGNWMLVRIDGRDAWAGELAIRSGRLPFTAEILAVRHAAGEYEARVLASGVGPLHSPAQSLFGAMLLAEKTAAAVLCDACTTAAGCGPPA